MIAICGKCEGLQRAIITRPEMVDSGSVLQNDSGHRFGQVVVNTGERTLTIEIPPEDVGPLMHLVARAEEF